MSASPSDTPPDTPDSSRALGRLQAFLKQIVYGGNDGIVTTFAIVAGFSGAAIDGAEKIGALAVLVFGLANLMADGVSMGLGEFLSTRSKRDLYDARRRSELSDLLARPEDGRREIAEMLEGRGLSAEDAGVAAGRLVRCPDLAVDLRLAYGTGLADMRTARPAAEGLITFLAFVSFGVIPLVPYFLLDPTRTATFGLSIFATLGALSALGFLRWRATEDSPVAAISETVGVGAICALVAYGTGALVGG
ncbi:VIT1/CCC1 transporter family protein [Psychromarinibacter sp. C21-152]|uniref:VIT1/CCC1 transporter family protein n=1 Tax=Psychromarinibacter sediminicola TaxID=3033385 RepID=A0AAE3NUY4_9RHOB|nr:VIT1/CCC1 transporter family protein [Psychromarinibacter sediminicola]MDF0602734.1 VIT1/CCC1 transporter family protein [Psychromarinibacter sediminicola]